jgi:glycosyltransferase involved in cell wall biosynthesis
VTVHDLAFHRFPETVSPATLRYRYLVPAAVHAADVVVTVSEAVADEIIAEFHLSTDRVVVAPNGVDPQWFTAKDDDASRRARLGLPDEFLVFVGNLEPRKNLSVLLHAHALARRSTPEVLPLVLVGPAAWGDPWAGGSGPDASVVRTGFVSDADLRAVVAGARAVCLPSIYEGFGLPIIEAFATGTAVIASDISAHREITEGLATLLDPTDVDAWAQALVDASTTDDGLKAAAARQAQARRFTWERSARIHLAAYRRAAAT